METNVNEKRVFSVSAHLYDDNMKIVINIFVFFRIYYLTYNILSDIVLIVNLAKLLPLSDTIKYDSII